MRCVKIRQMNDTDWKAKDDHGVDTETWTYKFKSEHSKTSHTIVSERPLDFEIGEIVTPEVIAAAQRTLIPKPIST